MKLDENSIPGIMPPGLQRPDGKWIEATKNQEGNIVISKGPFGFEKHDIGPIGSLDDPQLKARVEAWYNGEDDAEGGGSDSAPAMTRQQARAQAKVQKGFDWIERNMPGTGLGPALLWLEKNLGAMRGTPGKDMTSKIWNDDPNSGGLMYRLKQAHEQGIEMRAEVDLETNQIKPVFNSQADSMDMARAVGSLVKLFQHAQGLERMEDGPGKAHFLKTVMEMFHTQKLSGKSRVFVRTFPDDIAMFGISFNLSENHEITKALEDLSRRCKSMEKVLREQGHIDESEAPYDSPMEFDGFGGKGSGMNVASIRKDVSEVELEIVQDLMQGRDGVGLQKAIRLYRKYEESIQEAMRYDDRAIDKCGAQLMAFRDMVADLGKTEQDGLFAMVGNMLNRRRELLKTFKPDAIVRVGEGVTGAGDKPDVLFLYNEKPEDLDEYAYQREDGKWVVGVSLKTYDNDEAEGQKTGETAGLKRAAALILKPENRSHFSSVASQIGLKPKQVREIEDAARDMEKVADLCISLKDRKFNNLDTTKSNEVICDQVFRTLEDSGLKLEGLERDQVMTAIKDAKTAEKVGKDFMTKLGNRLEKALMSNLTNQAMLPDGTMDPKHPQAMLAVAMWANSGMDTQNGAKSSQGRKPVLNATAFCRQDRAFHYNANDDISEKAKAALSGKLPMKWASASRGALTIGDCARLKLEGGSNKNIVNAYSSHTKQC